MTTPPGEARLKLDPDSERTQQQLKRGGSENRAHSFEWLKMAFVVLCDRLRGVIKAASHHLGIACVA